MDNLSFYILTDPHYYEPSLGATGEEYEKFRKSNTRCVGETSYLFDAAKDILLEDKETDIVLMPGDLTSNGEAESHKSFIKELEKLKQKGKKIYVITAAHDYNDNPVGFNKNGRYPVEGTKRQFLPLMYRDFGFGEAIATYSKDSHSYVVQLSENIRLLALNCDGNCKDFMGGFFDEQLQWAKEQIEKAHKDNNYIFAMTHYPLIPGNPVFSGISDAKLQNWDRVAEFFADAGLDLIFTGHMHMQSVRTFTSKKGNKITDVCTSATSATPGAVRKVTILGNGKIQLETKYINKPELTFDGKGVREYLDYRLIDLIDTAVNNMADDYEAFMDRISAKPVPALKPIVTFAGRKIRTLTFSKLGKLLFVKVDDKIKNKLVKDFIYDCVIHIFAGDSPYYKGTPEYGFLNNVFKKHKFIMKIVNKKFNNPQYKTVEEFVFAVIGNPEQKDNNGIINLK